MTGIEEDEEEDEEEDDEEDDEDEDIGVIVARKTSLLLTCDS